MNTMQLPPRSVQFTFEGRVASKKNSKRILSNRYTGQTFIGSSKAFINFESDLLPSLQAIASKGKKLKPPYVASYQFKMKGKGATDLDNMIASINDIMQKAEIIEDDKHIERFIEPTEKVLGCKEYEATITVWGY
jgi:hypothetical protein